MIHSKLSMLIAQGRWRRRAAIASVVMGLLLAASIPFAAGLAAAFDKQPLQTYAEQQFDASRISSGVVMVTQGSEVKLSYAHGAHVTKQTPFVLGSLSKSFTALAVMQLVEQNKVKLDAPVRTYIPWFAVADAQASTRITVRQLLHHQSGIPTAAGMIGINSTNISLEENIRRLHTQPLVSQPGTTYQYSNANYGTLGLIIQEVSGMSYAAYMQANVFAPLDMRHTFTDVEAAKKAGLVQGYTNWFGFKNSYDTAFAPAFVPEGYIISTAQDISHYMMALLNDGIYDGQQVLSAESVKQLHEPAVPINGEFLYSTSYAMGWAVGKAHGQPIITHGGDVRNFHGDIGLLPKSKTGVAVLVNENSTLLRESQTFEGIVQGVTMGKVPPVSNGFVQFYVIFNTIVATSIGLMGYGLWRLKKWSRRAADAAKTKHYRRFVIRAVLFDIAIAGGVYMLCFYGLGYAVSGAPLTYSTMMYSVPDLTAWVLAIIGYFIVRAVAKAAIAFRTTRSLR